MSALSKVAESADEAVAPIKDGSCVLVGGFGDSGVPFELLAALERRGASRLTIVSNNCGTGEAGLAAIFRSRLVTRVLASFPIQPDNHHFAQSLAEGLTDLELVPQGTLAERLHAGAAGLGGFFTPVGVETDVTAGKETRVLEGRLQVLEQPIRGDFALVRAHTADRRGNLRYHRAARNFNPVMAMAATHTIAEVDRIVDIGDIDPDDVHTASPFVDTVVRRTGP